MIDPVTERLHDGHLWLRVADSEWVDPLDPTYAQHRGGRWNPPNSHVTLYLNEDRDTARAQIQRMLESSPVRPEDIDGGFVLIEATLPSRQDVADALTNSGVEALGLPKTYPLDDGGQTVPHEICQPIGTDVKALGLRGIHARSAATPGGSGRELAWFPARRSSRALPVGDPIPFEIWWYTNVAR